MEGCVKKKRVTEQTIALALAHTDRPVRREAKRYATSRH
jgi:hypothetical protein